jgi:hypothetical protein
LALLSLGATAVLAQSVCDSDAQPRPQGLVERFISADCAHCWTAPDPAPVGRKVIALDWVVPGQAGEDAPLSAVARRDSLERLVALQLAAPAGQSQRSARMAGRPAYRLRVAHGIAFNGYLGVSIEVGLTGAAPAGAKDIPLTGWLALVETLPPGTEGSPVERQLVRGLFQADWNGRRSVGVQSRSMAVGEGVNPERLSLVGWLEDTRGRLLALAQSGCLR